MMLSSIFIFSFYCKDAGRTRSLQLIQCSSLLLLNDPPRMDEDETTRRLLHFTLEIISLLSGEDYTIVRKTPGEGVTPIIHLQESGGRSPDPITQPPPHLPIHERRKKKKILVLSNKMIELLSGEVPIRCQDVAVYLSMEEWEYLEGHQDRYQEVMMEELRPLTSPVVVGLLAFWVLFLSIYWAVRTTSLPFSRVKI
ncbi:gastrula zinc finger protein XlCGF66.1-like [Phyllobates terribilis]|uniref:gastrula zinc finger protein XlCGF66.1-like n=1 Tax=Phyllobates terribilis TaxID=111132 RepID=UPI003CCA78F8